MVRIIGILLALMVLASCSAKRGKMASSLVVETLATPADSLTGEPHLFTTKDGSVLLSWVEERSDSGKFLFSKLNGVQWSNPVLIAAGSDWFVNWADYPMIAADGNNLVAHMLTMSAKGTYTYDVKMHASTNGGVSWAAPFLLHDDGKKAEHGFVSLVPYGNNVFVAWLDGRNTAMEGMENMDHSGHHGAMSLRAAVIDYTGTKSAEWELDNKTCDCCQTAAAITDNGPIVIYRDRLDDEIRDISIVRYIDSAWTSPQSVNEDHWKIAGCPVNGPRVAAIGNQVVVAWFSGATDPAVVNVIFSGDGGATFGSAIRVDEGKAIGRVDVEWLDPNRVAVSWMEGGTIRAAIISANGDKEPAVTIAETSDARSSGFPQMTLSDRRLIFAWTDDKQKRVLAASVTWQ